MPPIHCSLLAEQLTSACAGFYFLRVPRIKLSLSIIPSAIYTRSASKSFLTVTRKTLRCRCNSSHMDASGAACADSKTFGFSLKNGVAESKQRLTKHLFSVAVIWKGFGNKILERAPFCKLLNLTDQIQTDACSPAGGVNKFTLWSPRAIFHLIISFKTSRLLPVDSGTSVLLAP